MLKCHKSLDKVQHFKFVKQIIFTAGEHWKTLFSDYKTAIEAAVLTQPSNKWIHSKSHPRVAAKAISADMKIFPSNLEEH